MAIVAVAQVKISPDLKTFRADLEAGLKKIDATVQVGLDVDTKLATTDLDAWRAKESKKSVKQKIDIDTSALDKIGKAGGSISSVTRNLQMATIAGTALISTAQAIGPLLVSAAGTAALLPAALIGGIGVMAAFKLGADGVKKAFDGLTPTLNNLKTQVSASFQQSLTPGVQQLAKFLPSITVGLKSIASAASGAFVQVANMLNSSGNGAKVNAIFIEMSKLIQNVGAALAPALQAMINIGAVGAPILSNLTSGIGDVVKGFATWTSTAQGAAKIQSIITGGLNAFQSIGQILQQVGGIIVNIFSGISAGAGDLGGRVLPVLQAINAALGSNAGQAALAALGSAVTALGSAFASYLGPALQAVLPYLTRVFEFIAQNAGTIAPIIAGFTLFGGIAAKLAPIVTGIVGAFSTFAPILKTVFTLIKGNPILLLVGALVAALAASGQLQPILNTLMGIFQQLMGAIMPPLVALFQQLTPVIQLIATTIGGALVTVLQALIPPITQLVSALLPPLMTVIQALAPVIQLVGQVFGALVTALAPIITLLAQLVAAILPPLIQLFTAVITPILDLAAAFLGAVIGAITAVIKWIVNLFTQLNQAGGILDTVKGWFSAAWNFIKGVWSAVAGFFSGVWNGITGSLSGALNTVKGWFSDAWNFIKGVFAGVGNFFSNVWSGITNGLKSIVNGAIKLLNGLITAANFIPGVNIGHIPYLARGGTADKNQPHIVGENGPELFIPGKSGRVVDNTNTVKALNGAASGSGGASASAIADAVAYGLSRASFTIDPSGQARITSRGSSLNTRR